MIISINARSKRSWGGGSHFVAALTEDLIKKRHVVCHNLSRKVDAIIVVSHSSANACFSYSQIYQYLKTYPKTVVIQRINNLDTHANKGNLENYKKTDKIATGSVFVSLWAKNYLLEKKHISLKKSYIITNDVSEKFKNIRKKWDKTFPIKFVTHHWSTNLSKGFDVYRHIDEQLRADKSLRSLVEFMFIGRLPPKYLLKQFSKKTFYSAKLAEKLRTQYMYLTASLLECGPYHVIEALRSGLPVIYGPNGGAIEEYVGECGFCFDPSKPIRQYIDKIIQEYDIYYDKIVKRFANANIISLGDQYIDVIKQLQV